MTGTIPTMRVTEKGQVTIPKDLRDAAGLGAGSEVEFELAGDTIVLRKVHDGPNRGNRLAARLRGRGDVMLSTDEIMALTRSE
jgi:antitoxin PrlF